ncbi:MAG TPA: Rne/Rng family ribonuclease [bacterium]|nr:Rne/Rng family ribonuclease [bacterium]
MSREILANVDPFEVRVAVLEEGVLAGILLERGDPLAGNVYKGRVASVLPGMEAAFVDIGLERNAFLHVTDVRANRIEPQSGEELEDYIGRGPIAGRLRVGQEILVQVTKEPRGTKGARATTYVALPGHYLVLMPTVTGIGVSRRIETESERKRLRAIAERLRPEGMGLIVRTAAEGVDERDLADDVRFLLQLWSKVAERAATSRAPAVLYQDHGLIRRVVRDLFTGDVGRFVLDSPVEFERVRELVGSFAPELRERVQLHHGPEPIFDAYDVEREIERALHRKVWLRSGGYLVFDRTEAATVIDVNTGKYVGKTDLASTILRTNLEAAEEIARQIRLRDIGGIILVDFIDMDVEKHQRRVLAALNEAVRADRTKVHVIDLTQLGLVEITRKRVYQDLEELMRMACPYCEGRGRVLSPQSAAVRARRELRRAVATSRARVLVGYVHPEVAQTLKEHAEWLRALGREHGKMIIVRARPGMHLDRIVVAQGDDTATAERAAANGQAAKAARGFWLDPVHGEGLDLPDDEPREHVAARRADEFEAAPRGWIARLWRRLSALGRVSSPSPRVASGAGSREDTGARRASGR